MAIYIKIIILLIYLLLPTYHCYRHNDDIVADDDLPRKTLFINNDIDLNKPKIINRFSDFNNNIRDKRDVNNNNKFLTNITGTPSSSAATIAATQTIAAAAVDSSTTTQNPVKLNKNSEATATNNLNNKIIPIRNELEDGHAQLMVHWLGEGTNVMICLAREPPPSPVTDSSNKNDQPVSPSAVYISYDYGDKFINKTDQFKFTINGTETMATLDQFMTHPKFNTIVFTDIRNKAIFTSKDHGKTIQRHQLDFSPSDVSFYELDPSTFLILDKEDPERKIYYTVDFGETFTMLQSYVKTFLWSSGDGIPVHLYIERREPSNTSAVLFMNASFLIKDGPKKFNLLIENVQDFHIKKDFMFATRKVLNNTQLLISYKRGRFIKADFQTELDIKAIHVADVEGRRIMVSAVHSEIFSHLYVSESDAGVTSIKFVPSLENIFTYIPDIMWKTSWLVHTSDEAFTDLYKVEGLRGIYIASRISRPLVATTKIYTNIGPEHLISVISFDHGSSWNPITAPIVDDEGQMINCTKDCSLHLSQKFNQLYPVTRSVTIMSSKSAPGVIMASGVIGKSLKGHPGVFISRDAGLTWKQILKNYHFFNFGDHGGVLVAVKYFKIKGETNEILYSTDEGEKWVSQEFHSTDLKVYGLMTEPNTNTTIFTLFGSELSEHKWLIIKIDLKNAFSANCTQDDYKYWAPGSQTGNSVMPCVLGLHETYQRRVAHANCYNGPDYERPVRSEVCQCNIWDFECDFGFSRLNRNQPCIRNKTALLSYDPYKIPATCRPGQFYERTKGYRKIEGDVCVDGYSSQYLPQMVPCPFNQSNEFLVVAQRNKISRIDLKNGNKEVFPVDNLLNVIAIEFDIKNNCVFWADIMSDTIGRQCLNGNQSMEILVETELASVEGMSYDWVSELLFFVDGTRTKIEAVKTSGGSLSKMRRTIVNSNYLSKPRGVVVHPLEGYLFWTDWSSLKPSLSRSNLDGTDVRVLFTKPQVVWPNGVTIDYIAERVYWVDASKDYIASSDLQGKSFMKILDQDSRVAHPFAVAVYKDLMYWDDWKMSSIFSADKDHGIMIRTIADGMSSLMDLKVYAHSIQEGSNACANSNCSHICVGAPKGGFTCLCPDGMEKSLVSDECLCPGGLKPYTNKTCPQMDSTCGPTFFTCANKLCVSNLYRCDDENDCGDNSDEMDCIVKKPPCPPHMFTCKSDNHCIPLFFACDYDRDCTDGSDEMDCKFTKCSDSQFACKNGRCVSKKWVCDGEDDCRDNSDEAECKAKNTTSLTSCKPDEFRCTISGSCIPKQWRCDADYDCPDSSDEIDCKKVECVPWMFDCGDGHCIYKTWTCDGDSDCANGEDEKNCTARVEPTRTPGFPVVPSGICQDWMFKCANNKCVPFWWKCDGINDCGDNSDEIGCDKLKPTPLTPITTSTESSPPQKPIHVKCSLNEYHCGSGVCIPKRYVCDGLADCVHGDDEDNCSPDVAKQCGFGKFRCRSDGFCLPIEKYCDKQMDCLDGSDEEDCKQHPNNKTDTPSVCQSGFFSCDNMCLPLHKICDSVTDCYDGSDEKNCKESSRIYQVVQITADERNLNATQFVVFWLIPTPQNIIFEFLPSIALAGSDNWKNNTEWLRKTEYNFINLRPYTTYNVTIYVRIMGSDRIFPPYLYFNVTTAEGVPTVPINIRVQQLNGSRVQVSWDPPKEPYGTLVSYTVYYLPEIQQQLFPVQHVKATADERTVTIEYKFQPNVTYQFWVRASNTKYDSPSSILSKLTFDGLSNVDDLTGIVIKSQKNHTIEIEWNPIKNVDGYVVQPLLPQPYPRMESIRTIEPRATIRNMTFGVQYVIKVSAFVKNYFGRPQAISITLSNDPLPLVPNVAIQHTPDKVLLHWSKPKTVYNDLLYGIYYGTSMDDLIDKPRIITTQLSAEVKDLLPCKSYLIAVGIVGPVGPGPLGRNLQTIETKFNSSEAPKNLRAEINEETNQMTLNWEHSCPFSGFNLGYIIIVTELQQNKTSRLELQPTKEKAVSHTFNNIPHGASYNISISTNTKNAELAYTEVKAPPLPIPQQLKVWPEKNGTFVVYWKEIEEMDENYQYEIVVFLGFGISNTSEPIFSHTAKKPPFLINPENLGADSPGKVYTVGIRVKSDKGFYSDICESENVDIHPDTWITTVLPTSTSVWLVVIPILLVITLVAIVFYVIQRHRRLQSSFSRFANSHYDTKTGATRIGDVLDDDEHQDAPRFADDEPLVIA